MKTKLLLATAVACFYFATASLAQTVPSYVPTNGLVGWWPFNGNANDESGNGNNGTVNGATLTSDRNGNANEAYSFDGVDDIISTSANSIPTTGTLSLSVWLKPEVNFGIAEFISLGSPSSTTWGALAGSDWNGSPYLKLNYGRGCSGTGGTNPMLSPVLNDWQNITYVSSGLGGNTLIYVNGVFMASATNGTSNVCSITNLYFGSDIFGPNFLDCKLDDIGIWNRALTQQEITALYTSQAPCTKPEPVSLGTSASTRLCPSESVTIEIVTPADSANYTYQWTRNGTNMVGATTRSITVNDAAKYKVFVSSGPG
ncbi:MAG: LamG domain-containing protein, partial [Bacteroidota bacterium]